MTRPGNQRQVLGERLRKFRTEAGLRAVDLAERIGTSQGQISRIENGKRRISPDAVRRWLEATSAPADVVDQLVEQAKRADTEVTAWKERFAGGWGQDQRDYEELEREATAIYAYQVSVIPGLLTTPGYVEFILREIVGLPDDQVAAGITARMSRQRLLYQPTTRYNIVLAEHVLRHRFPGAAVMVEQLHRIEQLATLPTVDLAVIPVNTDMALPYMVSFDLFEMPDDDDIVLIELDTGEVREREPERVDKYRQRHSALRAAALTGQEAVDLVHQVANEMTATIFHNNPG